MTDMPILLHFICCSLATVGFSIFLNSPKNALLPSGLIGGFGWSIYYFLVNHSYNDIIANFIAAFIVSLISELLARRDKHPALLFVIPGIIPLVPGLGMYNTMLSLVESDFNLAISTGVNVILVAISISLGVLVVTSLFRTINILIYSKKTKN